MDILFFFIESFNNISYYDLKFIIRFYLPIIGPFSIILYEYLSGLEQNNLYKPSISMEELSKLLSMNQEDIILAKKNLEAVGLIKTFIKNDNKNGIINVLKPLSFENFLLNNILKSHLIKKIGDLSFEKLIMGYKSRPISKNDYIETSSTYFDIFDYSFKEEREYITSELKLPVFNNKKDAISGLTPNQYIQFLDIGVITFGQKEYINYARNIGLCDRSINTILDYSFEVNGRIIVNFIKKITNDLYERNLISFKEIFSSLDDSINSKKQKKSTKYLDWGYSQPIITHSKTKEISLNNLLEDLEELM